MGKRLSGALAAFLCIFLAFVFALQFGGPQAEGCVSGGSVYAAKVYGHVITEGDFRAAYVLAGFGEVPLETARALKLRETVLEGLIDRLLLARQARALGFRSSEEDVWRRVAEDGSIYMSINIDTPIYLPPVPTGRRDPGFREILVSFKDRNGKFDKGMAERFINFHLRRAEGEFIQSQLEEELAYDMRNVLLMTARVSPEEVWKTYLQREEKARIEYVRFSQFYFQKQIHPTDAEIENWLAKNKDKVDQDYKATLSEDAAEQSPEAVAKAKFNIAKGLYLGEKGAELAERQAKAAWAALHGGTSSEELRANLEKAWPIPPAGSETNETNEPTPRWESSAQFTRDQPAFQAPYSVTQIGRDAFALTKEQPLFKEPVKMGQEFVVYRLADRVSPVRKDFTPDVQFRAARDLLEAKRHEVLKLYLAQLRKEADADGAIHRNQTLLSYREQTADGEGS